MLYAPPGRLACAYFLLASGFAQLRIADCGLRSESSMSAEVGLKPGSVKLR